MGYELIINPLPSTAGTIGGVWANKISQLFSGIDTSVSDPTNQPTIATPTKFLYQALRIRDSPNAKSVIFQGPGALDVDKTILIPTMPVGLNTDTLLLQNMTQPFTQKTMDLSLNLLTETGKALGAILKHDGVEYTGLPRGTINQVLISTGTDVAWATLSSANLPSSLVFDNVAETLNETLTINKTAQASIAEEILNLTVSDDTIGYVKLKNSASGGGLFSPAMFSKCGTLATSFFFIAESTPANDTGTAPLMIIDCRRDDNTVIQTRPLLAFRNSAGQVYFQFNALNQVITSPVWATLLVSNVVGNAIRLANGGALAAFDSTATIRNVIGVTAGDAINLGASSGWIQLGFFVGGERFRILADGTVTISPTWATPLTLANNVVLRGTRTDAAVRNLAWIDTSNVLSYGDNSGNGSACRIFGGSSSGYLEVAINTVTTLARAQAGVAETLASWTVSDDTSSFVIANTSSVDAIFAPRFTSSVSLGAGAASSSHYWQNVINVANDTGTTGCWVIDCRRSDATDVAVRPLFVFRNRATEIYKIGAKGDQTQTTIAQAGVAEILSTWTVGDNPNSEISFRNFSAVDGEFAPDIRSRYLGTLATEAALVMDSQILAANDSGTTPVLKFLLRTSVAGAIVTRPLLDVLNNVTSVFKIDAKGGQTCTTIAGVGVAETLCTYLVSDDAVSWLDFRNASTTDGHFSPWIRARYAGTSAGLTALQVSSQILAASDTGTTPISLFVAQTSLGADIVNRPLFDFRNNATSVFRIDPNGKLILDHKAQAGGAEICIEADVTDDASSYWRLANISTTDGEFIPRMIFNNNVVVTGVRNEFLFQIPTAGDIGTTPLLSFLIRNSTGNVALVTKPLLDVRNGPSSVLQINARGDISQTIIAQAGAAEVLHRWTVSDNIASYLDIRNSSANDGMFTPRLVANVSSAVGAAVRAMYYQHYISSTMDSGTTSVVAFDARLSNDTPVLVRPLFEWYNDGTIMLQINPWGVDFKDFTIKNMYGVATQPTFEKTGHWIPSSTTLSNGYGLFAGIVNSGTGAVSAGANGSLSTFSVSTGAQLQGIKTDAPIFRGDHQLTLSIKASASLNTDSRIAIGFSNQATIQNAANPLANAHIGIMMGWGDTDANIQIFFSEGTTAAKFDTGVVKNTSINHWGIRYNGTTWQYCFNVSAANPVWTDVTGVTTPTTTAMYFHAIASCVATAYSFQPRAADIKAI